ncbi:MAG TPA: ABC transporter ATP-binding protein, partial [Acetobacteraceae bacterium]|nr:ABC transporter ATP-binding protein [Acetobacteraceae bacterium]
RAGELNVIPALSFKIAPGAAFGLVGESGSGKSTVALAIMRYLGRAGQLVGGRILFQGRDMALLDPARLRAIRGRQIAMVYQDPMSSLNPVMTVGRQLMEVPRLHERVSVDEARRLALATMADVELPDPALLFDRYPHQLSGGQQQRIVIAMALIARPALLIMDEPTTGLDVTVEAAILDLVRGLRSRHDTALLFISHNLGTVAQICDRVGVMYGGELVEEGPVEAVFSRPGHPYARGLLDCLPRLGADKHGAALRPIPGQGFSPLARPPGCVFALRCSYVQQGRCTSGPIPLLPIEDGHRAQCVRIGELPPWTRPVPEGAGEVPAPAEKVLEVEGLGITYRGSGLFGAGRPTMALEDVDLQAERGRTLAIVGESGCGKSSLARILAGLQPASTGRAALDGIEIGRLPVERRPPALRQRLQMVFQNPDATLNPSQSVGTAIARTVRKLRGVSGAEARRAVGALLEAVELPAEFAGRMPHQLSGGQKQRVAIARALAGDAEVLLADEPVSALDVSVQASVVNLLARLQATRGATLLFISHDLAMVRHVADSVAVMYLGRVMETGPAARVFAPPWHPYTEALLSAVPEPDPERRGRRIVLKGAMPSAASRPRGCVFSTRCPRRVGPVCDEEKPPEQDVDGLLIACHIPAGALHQQQALAVPAGSSPGLG